MNHVAYSHGAAACARFGISGLAIFTLLGGLGCTAGVRASSPGTGGTVGATGAAGATGQAGTTGSGRAGVTGSDVGIAGTTGTPNPDAAACQQMNYMFTATNPTVYILVDRSGSEFDSNTTGSFFTLRTAVEQVISSTVGSSTLDSQVRFGLGSFVGDHSSGSCMLNFQSVPIALNNAAAIKTAYDGWGPLQPYGSKADTPAVEAIPMVKAALQADNGTGQKYMMIVTDSETDFCDDGSALCPADAVTYMIQDLYSSTPSIGTLVIGLPTSVSNIAPAVLQNFANAGVGQPVAIPQASAGSTTMASDVYYQCNGQGTAAGTLSWSSIWTAAGRTGLVPIATYSATGGNAPVYTPSTTDAQALANQISMALAGVRSCTFDLSTFTINLQKLGEAIVYFVDGSGNHVTIPLDPNNANGWDMTSASELQLFGPACDQLRDPTTMDIKFNFPCDIVVPPPS
ncbi:MAG TPA: hypothetical protein VFG23_04085 [Polyangia bacterium]|nr:hypothetical protein [Polyangia bacterium]